MTGGRRFAAVAAASALAVLAGCTGPGRTSLRILYTGSLNGNLDGCTCHYHPRAGLVKAAAWLRSYPGRRDALLVDAGDLLAPEPDLELAGEMIEAFGDLSYDAVAVGDQEIAGGALPGSAFARRIPLLAGNLVLPADAASPGQPPLGRELVVRRAGWTVGLFALLDPSLAPEAGAAPPEQAARDAVARLVGRRVDLVVLLFHGPRSAVERLVGAVPGIDAAIFAHEQELVPPYLVGGTIVASPGEEGNRVCILEVAKRGSLVAVAGSGFHELDYLTDPDDPDVRARIDRYRRSLRPTVEPEP